VVRERGCSEKKDWSEKGKAAEDSAAGSWREGEGSFDCNRQGLTGWKRERAGRLGRRGGRWKRGWAENHKGWESHLCPCRRERCCKRE